MNITISCELYQILPMFFFLKIHIVCRGENSVWLNLNEKKELKGIVLIAIHDDGKRTTLMEHLSKQLFSS